MNPRKTLLSLMPEVVATLRAEGRSVSLVNDLEEVLANTHPGAVPYYEGGRESVDDALAIIESFGPGIEGLNDTFARQIVLADEVKRLRGLYAQAVAGRAAFRTALRTDRDGQPAQDVKP